MSLINTMKSILAPLVFPDEDWGWTWELHGNLAGHIEYAERFRRTENILRRLCEMYDREALARLRILRTEMKDIMRDLRKNLGNPDFRWGVKLDITLVSGYSRSGGTYVLSELAHAAGRVIQHDSQFLVHDWWPIWQNGHATPVGPFRKEIYEYMAVLLLYAHHRPLPYYKRTALGAMSCAWLDKLAANVHMDCNVIHLVRDIPSAKRSLDIMYDGFIEAHGRTIQRDQACMYLGYDPGPAIDTFLLNCANWWMANTAMLPDKTGLPGWETFMPLDYTMGDACLEAAKTVKRRCHFPLRVVRYEDIGDFCKELTPHAAKFNLKPMAEEDNPLYRSVARKMMRAINEIYLLGDQP